VAQIHAHLNQISVSGNFGAPDVRPFVAVLHKVVRDRGYKNVTIDLTDLRAAFEVGILPIVPVVERYRLRDDCDVTLVLPADQKLSALFVNTNWAHFLAPLQYAQSSMRSHLHLPAQNYRDLSTLSAAVDNIMNIVLNTIPDLQRTQLQALEWSIQEISDNVLNHSRSDLGGYIQASTFSNRRLVEFVVCDGGVGIPTTLNMSSNHPLALEQAIKEGITRDPNSNAGNGLFGSLEVSRLSRGAFSINSYCGALFLTNSGDVRSVYERVPYLGTSVTASISCSDSELLINALTFKGKKHVMGFDYLDKQFGSSDTVLTFHMSAEAKSFGTREVGRLMHNKICTVMASDLSLPVVFDFKDVPIISSSFADEVFGRLFADLGPMTFVSRFQFINVNTTVRALVDRAIMQRASSDAYMRAQAHLDSKKK